VIYLDTSALGKLVVVEPESPPLRRWLAENPRPRRLTSALARTELRRIVVRFAGRLDVARAEAAASARSAAALLDTLDQIRLGSDLLDRAGRQQPAQLRSLDAIHLVSALALGPELAAFVCYDRRLAAAAGAAGLAVVAPGGD
jgi:predicted nucleic acid-binding protein